MSCGATVLSTTNLKIRQENYKDLIEDIKNHNMKWEEDMFENLTTIQTIFDYFSIKILHNDLEGYVYIDTENSYFYDDELTDEIFCILAKYIEEGSVLEVNFADYETKEKYVFSNKRFKKYIQERVWKEV